MSANASEIEYAKGVQMYYCLRVTDLDEAIAFYQRVLGLELNWDAREHCDQDEMLHVEMSLPCAGARLLVGLGPADTGDCASGQLLLFVRHVGAVRDHLVANGVAVRSAVADDLPSLKCGREVYHYDFFVIRDPFGNAIYVGGSE